MSGFEPIIASYIHAIYLAHSTVVRVFEN